MENILELKGLTKIYKTTKVVDNVDLNIEKGHIYGLIGPNGAGKTTIMKMIAGLCVPNAGSISMFGSTENIDANRSRVSFMIEAPYIDLAMTAKQNMEYMRYVRGVADCSRIDEVLELVGLNNAGKKIAKNFSLGMKQRLGIAMALLPGPEMMILDEPVNGLDPEGIVEIRHLLKMLCEESGITILISSHILSELSELCTRFALIDKGHLIEVFTKEELEQKCRSYVAVAVDDVTRLTTVIEQKLNIKEYKVMENNEVRIYERLDEIKAISRAITDSGLILTKLNPEGENLEEYYLSKVSHSDGEKMEENKRRLFGIGGR